MPAWPGWYSDVAGDSISYADASKKPLYYAQVAAEKFITRRSEQGCEYERVEILEVE